MEIWQSGESGKYRNMTKVQIWPSDNPVKPGKSGKSDRSDRSDNLVIWQLSKSGSLKILEI